MTRQVLITGCSSGIGLNAARGLRRHGWRVFAACRKQEDCALLQAEAFESPRIDYDDPASIEAGLAEVLEATGGRIDALINNGAFALPGAVEDLPRDGLRRVLETNVLGPHDLTQRVIRVMRSQGDGHSAGHGRIINISSVLGLVAYQWRGAYCASKFALEGLTDTLRLEMRDTDIKIITVEPGPITSRIRANSVGPFERWIDWRASARREQYENDLLDRLYQDRGPDRFELDPSHVTAKLRRALDAPNPRPRYYVTTPTYIMGSLRRILPTRALDWVISRG